MSSSLSGSCSSNIPWHWPVAKYLSAFQFVASTASNKVKEMLKLSYVPHRHFRLNRVFVANQYPYHTTSRRAFPNFLVSVTLPFIILDFGNTIIQHRAIHNFGLRQQYYSARRMREKFCLLFFYIYSNNTILYLKFQQNPKIFTIFCLWIRLDFSDRDSFPIDVKCFSTSPFSTSFKSFPWGPGSAQARTHVHVRTCKCAGAQR